MTARAMTWLVVAAGVLAAPAARAQHDATSDTVTYRVHSGDTLELIAAEFYGDHRDAKLIKAENRIKRARSVGPGERLRIPVTRQITTSRGDTFESLAQTYLGDARRAGYLADFNGMAPDVSLAAGTPLTIPFHITHVATDTESLARVSEQFYGDTRHAQLLRDYNNLDGTTLDKGDSVIVPILDVRVRAGRQPALDAEAKARRARRVAAQAEAARALPRARTAWLEGDFAGVKAALAHVAGDVDYLDADPAVEIDLLLGKAHVAFGETDAAIEAFAQVLNRKPRLAMSPYAVSPKVIAAWKKAGGHVEGE